jgi:hypothetical protein
MSNTTHRCNTPHAHTGFAGLGFTMAVALPCTLALALGTAANAGVYKTTYILNTPYTDSTPNATQVVVNWSTNLTSGAVQQTDLTNWSIGLYGAGNVFYTDNVIIGGTVQSNKGVARGIADVLFQFNLDTDLAGDFDNMLAGITLTEIGQTLQTVVTVNYTTVEIIEIRGCKATTIELNHWT